MIRTRYKNNAEGYLAKTVLSMYPRLSNFHHCMAVDNIIMRVANRAIILLKTAYYK